MSWRAVAALVALGAVLVALVALGAYAGLRGERAGADRAAAPAARAIEPAGRPAGPLRSAASRLDEPLPEREPRADRRPLAPAAEAEGEPTAATAAAEPADTAPTLRVSVVDADGRPVKGATVTAFKPPDRPYAGARSAVFPVRPSGPGEFVAAGEDLLWSTVRVVASAPGLGFVEHDAFVRADGQRVVLPLAPGPTVRLRVLRRDGSPAALAPILVTYVDEDGRRGASTWSGPDGGVWLAIDPIGGDFEVSVEGLGRAVVVVPPEREGDALDLGDIVVEGVGVIAGTLALTDGTPLVGAKLEAQLEAATARGTGRPQAETTTDGDGRFELAGLWPGGYRLRTLRNDAYAFEPAAGVDCAVESEPGGEALTLRLDAALVDLSCDPAPTVGGPRIVGEALDTSGGAAERTVSLVFSGARPTTTLVVPLGAPRAFRARHPEGRLLAADLPLGLDGGRHALVLAPTDAPRGTLTVRLSGAGQGVPASLVLEAVDGSARIVATPSNGLLGDGDSRSVTLLDVPPGRWRVTPLLAALRPDGGAGHCDPVHLQPVRDVPAELERRGPRPAVAEPVFTLEVADGATVERTVTVTTGTTFILRTVAPEGADWDRRNLTLRFPDLGAAYTAWTEVGGTARYPRTLPPGTHALELEAVGIAPARASVTIDGEVAPLVEVVLEPQDG